MTLWASIAPRDETGEVEGRRGPGQAEPALPPLRSRAERFEESRSLPSKSLNRPGRHTRAGEGSWEGLSTFRPSWFTS